MKTTGCSFGGEFKFTILDANRKVKRETDWMPNLITNIGLDRIAEGAVGAYCRIGTGNTAPANANTDLVSQAAWTATGAGAVSISNAGAPNYETEYSKTYEFALGGVVGNMAEIGIGWDSTGNTLFSRALILDGVGAPTTISVTADDILQATYRLTVYPTLTDSTGTVDIGGVTYDYIARIASCESALGIYVTQPFMNSVGGPVMYDGAIGAVTAEPSGSALGISPGSLLTYTPGSHYIDYTVTAGLTEGNLAGGTKSIRVNLNNPTGSFARTQIEFSPNIPKDGTMVFSMVLRQSWSRH